MKGFQDEQCRVAYLEEGVPRERNNLLRIRLVN